MSNAAIEFINAIASNMEEANKPLISIKDALEDAEALDYLGVTDEDQEMVEEAHDIICNWIKEGKEFI